VDANETVGRSQGKVQRNVAIFVGQLRRCKHQRSASAKEVCVCVCVCAREREVPSRELLDVLTLYSSAIERYRATNKKREFLQKVFTSSSCMLSALLPSLARTAWTRWYTAFTSFVALSW
jgi:hypothetical protein